jgi:hypothetical protein
MKKEEIISHLRAAKSAHIKWLQKAKMLINGLDIEEDAIPVNSTECKFGKWFYTNGQVLNGLSNNPVECMNSIEKLHFDLHDVYLKIFTVYFSDERKTGFFAKLFKLKRKKISDVEHRVAEEYYNEMEKISKILIEEINKLERRLIAVSDEKIEALI